MADGWRGALTTVTETVFPSTKVSNGKDRSRLMPVGKENFGTPNILILTLRHQQNALKNLPACLLKKVKNNDNELRCTAF